MRMLREGRQISPPTKASRFPCRKPSEGARISPFSQPAFPAGLQGVKFPYIRKNIFAYAEIYFRAHRNKFSSARKYFFFRKEINFLAEGNFSPCGRRILSLRKGILFRSKGREFLFGQKLLALRKDGNFPSKENNFSKAGKLLFQARKVLRLRPSARAESA